MEEEDVDEATEFAENIERVLDCRPSRTNPAEIHVKFKGALRMFYNHNMMLPPPPKMLGNTSLNVKCAADSSCLAGLRA